MSTQNYPTTRAQQREFEQEVKCRVMMEEKAAELRADPKKAREFFEKLDKIPPPTPAPESEYARWVAAAALEERRARLAPFLAWLPEPTTHGKKGQTMAKPGFRTVRCLP